MSISLFWRQLGQTISLALAQGIFLSDLLPQMQKVDSNITAQEILETGAARLLYLIQDHSRWPEFLAALARSVGWTSVLAAILAAVGTVIAIFIPWKSVKKAKTTQLLLI